MLTAPSPPAVPDEPERLRAVGDGSRKRLLLVKFGAIGDVIMAIPAAAAMRGAGYAVTWVASETVAPVLRLYPWIEVIAADEARLLRGAPAERLRAIAGLWSALGGRRYDLCATLYYDRRYRLLSLPVRAKRRVSLSWEHRSARLLPGRHHTDEYARILLGHPDGEAPQQWAPVPVVGLPPSLRRAAPDRPRVVLVPGGARNLLRDDALRRWPVQHYVTLAEQLLRAGHEVVLAGGKEDLWVAPFFKDVAAKASAAHFADLTGELSLVETLALLDSAEVTVTHDTGPLHLAGLTRTAIVTIFGPTDPRGRLPRRGNCVALWGGEGFACRPCYDGRDYPPCPHNGCMDQVTPAWVLAEIQTLLGMRAAGTMLPPRVLTPEPTPALVALGASSVQAMERR